MKWESLNLGFYHEWNSFNELSRNKSSKFRLKILPENFNRTNCRPSSSHTVQREKDVGWVIVFLFWFIDGFYDSLRFDWITERNHLRIGKKSRVVVCPRMRIYRDEFLETEKKRTEWKKKSFTPFGYLANLQNYLFLLPRETNLIFNIGK